MAKQLVVTFTGEQYQPSRIYYKCSDKDLLRRKLNGLRCMDFDHDNDNGSRWAWVFADEAKKIELPKSFNEVPRHLRPVGLGSFHIREDEVFLDIHSYDRVFAGLRFFGKHIPEQILAPYDVTFVNRFFSQDDIEAGVDPGKNHDKYFANTFSTQNIPMKILKEAEDLDNFEMLTEQMDKATKQPIEWVERLPLHKEETVDSIESTMRMRSLIALEHWNGNTDYSMKDLIHRMVSETGFLGGLDLDEEMFEEIEENT